MLRFMLLIYTTDNTLINKSLYANDDDDNMMMMMLFFTAVGFPSGDSGR